MFTLTLVTPEKRLVANQEIEEVFVPAFRGELNVLPGHAPLMTPLKPGILKYRLKGEQSLVAVSVSSGYCQVNPLGVNVMAEAAERPEEVEIARSEASLKAAEDEMLDQIMNEETLEKNQAKIARARARIELVKTGGTTH